MEKRSPHERVTLRIPPDLYKKLIKVARGFSPPSSLNTEILRRLYESFQIDREEHTWAQTVNELQQRLADLEQRLAEAKDKG